MLRLGEVNPLNVHGLRQLTWLPPHFERVQFVSYITDKTISDWIYENLEGRYAIGHVDTLGDRYTQVAFEIPGEATYFSLHLTQLNQL